jgi:hypothetical protein
LSLLDDLRIDVFKLPHSVLLSGEFSSKLMLGLGQFFAAFMNLLIQDIDVLVAKVTLILLIIVSLIG